MRHYYLQFLLLLVFSTGQTQTKTNENLDFLKPLTGNWVGQGFVTDNQGIRQDVNVIQHVNLSTNSIIVDGTFKNPNSGFKADFIKQFYYSNYFDGYRVKIYFEKKYFSKTKFKLIDDKTYTYSFRNLKNKLNRVTISTINANEWSEKMEQLNGKVWELKRDLILKKSGN